MDVHNFSFPLSFITENPLQCPGAPAKPELKDWDSDHFDMRWQEQEQEQERLCLWQYRLTLSQVGGA